MKKELRWVTGVCCQWRCSASYDSEVQIETFVLRGKFSGYNRHRTATADPLAGIYRRKLKLMKKLVFAVVLLNILSVNVQTLVAQDSIKYFTIRVIDSKTGRGVPLVELKTSSSQCYFTDSRGIIAFDEPTLMNQMVSFNVFSHGYECPKDGLTLNTLPGTSKIVKIKRLNIAERLYRITGQDIYGQSALLGLPSPIKHQALNGKVMGQDTYIETLYKGKIYWFWGDTNTPNGFNGETTGATSELPGKGGLDPSFGIDLTYFVDGKGVCKPICPFYNNKLVWIRWLATLPDENKNEHLFASYVVINQDNNEGESGFAVFNDSTETFERIKVIDAWYGKGHRQGHPFIATIDGLDYFYIINHSGIERIRTDFKHLIDPTSYDQFTCFAPISLHDTSSPILERDATNKLVYGWKSNAAPLNHRLQKDMVDSRKMSAEEGLWQFQDFVTGNSISVDPASVFWNNYRKRWVMIAYEFVSGVWFFEGDTPTGPWVYGRKIVSYDNYDFYNVGQHPLFDQEEGRLIYFEGTYTTGFSRNKNPTPLYDYNQIMYRLALDDPKLSLPAPVYLVKNESEGGQYLMREGIDSLDLWKKIQGIPFFALPVSNRNNEAIPIYASKSRKGTILTTSPKPSNESRPLFYALPTVAKPKSQSDPITGTWKCNALMPNSTYVEFDLSLEKEGEDVTGSNEAGGHFRNDTLTLSFRIFDYSLTGRLQGGKLIGEYRKDDGTEIGNWSGIGPELNKEEPVSSSIVFLYEYRKVSSEEIFYSFDPGLASSLITRTAQPVCRVWLNPSSVLALDYKAKPVQPGK